MKLQVGNNAPSFTALDQDNGTHTLGDYKGKWVLLYFYPKDDTPGCTTEACKFRDAYVAMKQMVVILGVSSDSVESHKQFAEKYHIPFPLLSDPQKSIITAYGADGAIFTKRTSFLIDPDGVIKKIYEHVNPEIHTKEVIDDVREFTQV